MGGQGAVALMSRADDPPASSTGLPSSEVLVVGLGVTGLSCVRHLRARGARVSVVDSRSSPPELEALRASHPEVPVHLGAFRPALFERAGALVMSPGVALAEPAVAAAAERGVPAYGDVELFAREAAAPVVAITGSNGKSTVTSMVGAMAQSARRAVKVGGNLGPPVLSLLEGKRPELYVLELSSFQLETTFSLEPAAATVLNIAADHMDRYEHLSSYARAKQRIFNGAGAMIINLDDPWVAAMAKPARPRIDFTLRTPAETQFGVQHEADRVWLCRGRVRLLCADELAVAGRHNVANALAALALGCALELPMPAMLEALRSFHGLPHRCELVATAGGVRWYNDSKGTNVAATVAAIEGLASESSLVLIAGGEGKDADFSALRAAALTGVRAAVLFGRDAALIEAALASAVPIERARDLDAAVQAAAKLAVSGDSVLFSPACASFDMFANYQVRGAAFRAAVRERVAS